MLLSTHLAMRERKAVHDPVQKNLKASVVSQDRGRPLAKDQSHIVGVSKDHAKITQSVLKLAKKGIQYQVSW